MAPAADIQTIKANNPDFVIPGIDSDVGVRIPDADLRSFRTRFGIPISDAEIAEAPFYRPPDDSPEVAWICSAPPCRLPMASTP